VKSCGIDRISLDAAAEQISGKDLRFFTPRIRGAAGRNRLAWAGNPEVYWVRLLKRRVIDVG